MVKFAWLLLLAVVCKNLVTVNTLQMHTINLQMHTINLQMHTINLQNTLLKPLLLNSIQAKPLSAKCPQPWTYLDI